MKRYGSIALVVLMLAGVSAVAQPGQQQGKDKNCQNVGQMGKPGIGIPGLTEDQQKKINELRVKHLKEITTLKNEMGEKKARMRTLQSVDKPDLNEINKVIDEMTAIHAKIMKKKAAHRVEVASVLTEEQRVFFNAMHGKRGNKHMMPGKNRGEGQKQCAGHEKGMNRNGDAGCNFSDME